MKAFWSELKTRNRGKLLDWISDQWERLLAVGGVLIFHVIFAVIHLVFPNDWLWRVLENIAEVGEVIIFVSFVYSQVRRSITSAVKGE